MAKIAKIPRWVDKLIDSLRTQLAIAGIRDAKYAEEPIPGTKLYRITVITPKFSSLRPSERQDLVWRIASRALSPAEQLRVSMILTLTPNEIASE